MYFPTTAPPSEANSRACEHPYLPRGLDPLFTATYAQHCESIIHQHQFQEEYYALSQELVKLVRKDEYRKLNIASRAQNVVQCETELNMEIARERANIEHTQLWLRMVLETWRTQHEIALNTARFLDERNPHYSAVNSRVAEIALYQPHVAGFYATHQQYSELPAPACQSNQPYAYLADDHPPTYNATPGAGPSQHQDTLQLMASGAGVPESTEEPGMEVEGTVDDEQGEGPRYDAFLE